MTGQATGVMHGRNLRGHHPPLLPIIQLFAKALVCPNSDGDLDQLLSKGNKTIHSSNTLLTQTCMPRGYEKNPPANITGSSKEKCPWREQDHSLLQQHPHTLELGSHCTAAGTAGFQPLLIPAEMEACGAAQAKQAGTMMEILMGGR